MSLECRFTLLAKNFICLKIQFSKYSNNTYKRLIIKPLTLHNVTQKITFLGTNHAYNEMLPQAHVKKCKFHSNMAKQAHNSSK